MLNRSNRRQEELSPDECPGVEIVPARSLTEPVQINVTGGIAWKGKATTFIEERHEAQFVKGAPWCGCKFVHGVFLSNWLDGTARRPMNEHSSKSHQL
jgi:hypothetical protein